MKYITDNGKELAIKYDGRNCVIQFTSGGELPQELKGLFTSFSLAKTAVLNYLAKRKDNPKGK